MTKADCNVSNCNFEGLPLFTIVMPSLNQVKYLEDAIQSVISQGYPNLEFIIIDGGSTDGSVEIIRRYQDHLDYWVSEPDSGQCGAINKGFALATGDWMAWLNSDDIYLPGALWLVAGTIQANAGCNWVVGSVDVSDVQLHRLGVFEPVCRTDDWMDFVCTKRKNGASLPQPGSFWSRRAWEVAGPLDETLHYAMDHEYWGRLAHYGFRPLCLQKSVAVFRQHMQSKTANGVRGFIADERRVIDNWIERVSATEERILINYRRTLKLRFIFNRLQQRIYFWLTTLHCVVKRSKKEISHSAD